MAKPRVFVSSTYYDLKHIRASLENFIESVGFEAVLFEKGDIPFSHDAALDESCYREVASADIFVLIVGGRYGSAASSEEQKKERAFFEQYDSITKKEHAEAVERDIPVYVLVEAGVDAEYQTYRKNRDNEDINYAHVGSVNIFKLLDAIFSQTRNNPVHTFERFSDIENWLRDQWAGRFREFLRRQSDRQQLSALSDQVAALEEANKTLANYLEVILKKVLPDVASADQVIERENERRQRISLLRDLPIMRTIVDSMNFPMEKVYTALTDANSHEDFFGRLIQMSASERGSNYLRRIQDGSQPDINRARLIVGASPFFVEPEASNDHVTVTPPPQF